jgi:hypothetical protein
MPVIEPRQLGGVVEFKVETALGIENIEDSALWGPDPGEGLWDQSLWNASEPYWINITSRALMANTSRGRDKWEQRYRTGQASNLLDNQDGVLSLSTGQLGDLQLRPGRWWRISGRVVGVTDWISLMLGQIDTMADKYSVAAASINSDWTMLDWFARWTIDDPPALEAPVGSGELTSDRVTRVLDIINWPTELRNIQTGINTMQSTTLAQSRLEEMATAADAEGGAFFVDGAGVATFKAQNWLEDDPRSTTPQLLAGAPGDHVQVLDASTDWSTSRVRNDVRMARKGGEEQRATDGQSESLYGPRTFQRYDLENDNDPAVLTLAERYLAAFRWDRSRLETVGLYPLDSEGARQMMELQLGDLIRLRISTIPGWNYTGEYYVNRISHGVTTDDWTMSLRIDDSDLAPPLGVDAFDDGYSDGWF